MEPSQGRRITEKPAVDLSAAQCSGAYARPDHEAEHQQYAELLYLANTFKKFALPYGAAAIFAYCLDHFDEAVRGELSLETSRVTTRPHVTSRALPVKRTGPRRSEARRDPHYYDLFVMRTKDGYSLCIPVPFIEHTTRGRLLASRLNLEERKVHCRKYEEPAPQDVEKLFELLGRLVSTDELLTVCRDILVRSAWPKVLRDLDVPKDGKSAIFLGFSHLNLRWVVAWSSLSAGSQVRPSVSR